ncbi:MAG: insulinase family protein [Gemmatimonadota bacterium]|nr:insulinase family protein [Gemmatimonadota bacterium]
MPWTDSVVRDVLPNGLTLLVQRDTSVPVVAVVTHVKAGYFDEPDRWAGISHVLEHMYFKGAAQLGPGALARETQRLGGYLNASTSYDRTLYYAVVPADGDGLERAVRLHADALTGLKLDPDELGRELEVIIQEAKRKLDTPAAVTVETLYELLFAAHRMRRWRIGTEAGLRALTAADVRAYYESRYAPDRVIVALTGNLDPEAALALGHRIYGNWQRPAAAIEPGPVEPDGRVAAIRVLRGDVERPLAAIGWRTVGPNDADTPALDVAAAVLGSGRASWLTTAIRVPGLASAVGASHFNAGDVGVFDVSLTSQVDRVEPAMRRAVGLVETLAGQGPDPVQLERVRALFATYWARRLESADGRATLLAEQEALGTYRRAETYRAALDAVTADDVRRVAARWLPRDAVGAVAYVPRAAESCLADLAWPPSEAAPPPSPLAPARRSAAVRASGGDETRVDGVHVVRWPGVDLVLRRRPGTGVIALGAYLPGLPGQETPANAGISRLLIRSALRGADGQSIEQLATAAELLGGAVGTVANVDGVGVTLAVHTAAARDGMALLRTILERPTLTPDDVMREAGLQADDAARRRDDMFSHPVEAVIRAAFGADAYGLDALGEPEIVRAIDADALRDWHAAALQRRALVVVVGDLEPQALRDAGAVFADWRGTDGAVTAQAKWAGARHLEERAKAQTALAMAFPAPPAGSDDRYGHAVLASLLSGLAGRLFDELREQRALAYTVHATPWLRRRAGAVLTYIATSPEREDEARTAMLDVLGAVADGPLPDEELDRARAYAAGLIAIRRQHAHAVAGDLADAWIEDRLDQFAAEEPRRRAVTVADLRRIARAAFDPACRAEYVVRGTGGGR